VCEKRAEKKSHLRSKPKWKKKIEREREREREKRPFGEVLICRFKKIRIMETKAFQENQKEKKERSKEQPCIPCTSYKI